MATSFLNHIYSASSGAHSVAKRKRIEIGKGRKKILLKGFLMLLSLSIL
jgi:hypothetical protein